MSETATRKVQFQAFHRALLAPAPLQVGVTLI